MEFETFKKCIEAQFGPDMERKILTNFYANYGDTKHIFDYMFTNLYSEKTTKLVKLNLEIDEESNQENKRKTEARLKNLELKKKLAKLKSKVEQENSETASLCKKLNEHQTRLQKAESEYKNKEMDCIAMDMFIKKVQAVCSKFELVARNLSFITAENTKDEDLKQTDLETLISKLKINENTEALTEDELNSEVNQTKRINLNAATDYCNSKINDDGEKIDQITGLKYLNNEVELILYQLDSRLFNSAENRKPNLNIFERINDNRLENIRRDCEKRKWDKEKSAISSQSKEIKLKLNEYLTRNYKETGLQLYATYLGSYLMLKRVEIEYRELKNALSFLKTETEKLQEISCSTQQKSQKINALMQTICAKQIELDLLLEKSTHSLDSKLQFSICQIKTTSESLLEQISIFNNCQNNSNQTFQSGNQTTVFQPSMTNQMNQTQQQQLQNAFLTTNCLVQIFNKFKSKFQLDNQNSVDQCEFPPETRQLFKRLFNHHEYQDKKGLFDQFIQVFKKLKSELAELDKLNKSQTRYENIKLLTSSLTESLNKCKSIDNNELFKYVDLLTQSAKKVEETKPELEEIEKLVTIWQDQPGAYECIPDDLTVNGKTLGHYLDMLNRTIAYCETLPYNQVEQINKQIGHLLMQLSHSEY